uniref:Uncharacterized protein n=1 Tax=Anguilla anguilla TaxID=7936 RepID=A0A0E9RP90_ANGAN
MCSQTKLLISQQPPLPLQGIPNFDYNFWKYTITD